MYLDSPRAQALLTLAAMLALSLLLIPYLDLSDGIGHMRLNFYSLGEEAGLGQKWASQIEQTRPRLDDPMLDRYVQRLGDRIVASMPLSPFTFQFRVLDSDVVNAYALPGGVVHVNLGLLASAQNEGELAGVLAHEIGHVVARHPTEKLSRHQLISGSIGIGGLIAFGGIPIPIIGLLTNLPELSFNRWEERQADDMAVDYLYLAGYHPESIATFFDRLWQADRHNPLFEFISSHPLSDQRATRVRWRFSRWAVDERWIVDGPDFQQIKRVALGWYHISRGRRLIEEGVYDHARQELDRAIAAAPRNAWAYYWRGVAAAHRRQFDQALADFNRSIELDPDRIEAYIKIGQMLAKEKDWDGVIRYWGQFLTTHPKNGRAYYDRAVAYSQKGERELARQDATRACQLRYEAGCKALSRWTKSSS